MNSTARPVLVTGAAGFVGAHLLQQLAGTADLVGWTRSAPPRSARRDVRWQQVDLLDRRAVHAALRDLRPSAVYHCAGVAVASGSWSGSTAVLAANALGTHHLLDGVRRGGMACRILLPGSALVYAPSRTSIAEQHALAPAGPYALSKLAQEALGIRAVADDGLDVVVTRSFNHTGPGQSDAFFAPGMARQVALIERGVQPPVVRTGNLDAVRDLSDVRDVARAYILLVHRGAPGVPYNVASGVGRTMREVLERILSRAQCSVRLEPDPARMRPHDMPHLVGDASRLRAATGWSPRIPMGTTIDDLLAYWRDLAARDTSSAH